VTSSLHSGVDVQAAVAPGDPFAAFINILTPQWAGFDRLSPAVAQIVGLVMLAGLIFGALQIILGIINGGFRGETSRRESAMKGREQLLHGILTIVLLTLLPILLLSLYGIVRGV